jgi:glycosyltransferase involved in cell wall biosynthesis
MISKGKTVLNRRKTIWIIDHYSSEPEYGGITRQYDFAKELDNRGYNVIIFSSGFSHYSHRYISEKELFIGKPFKHVRYIYLKTSSYEENNGSRRARNMISFLLQVLRYEKEVAKHYGKPDVVEGCSVHPLAWIAAYWIAKKYKIRFVAEIRDFWPQMWVASGSMKPFHPMAIFFGTIEKFIFKHADRIIYSLNHGDRYICNEKGVPHSKTYLIGQPMDCERYDQNRDKLELLPNEVREFLSKGFICAFTGYFMEYDGVYVMLEAQRILQEKNVDVKMLFVGSGQEREGMLEYVEKNNLQNVFIGERVPKEAVPALLSQCDACMAHIEYKDQKNVFRYGVSKNKINEYLYSGVCTLFGFRFSDNEVTESGGGLQYEPYNAEDLAGKIEYLYKLDKTIQERFGDSGRAYIQKKHNVDVLTDKLLEALF